jgi:hypothetical protein
MVNKSDLIDRSAKEQEFITDQKEIIKKAVPRSKVNGRVGLRLNSR